MSIETPPESKAEKIYKPFEVRERIQSEFIKNLIGQEGISNEREAIHKWVEGNMGNKYALVYSHLIKDNPTSIADTYNNDSPEKAIQIMQDAMTDSEPVFDEILAQHPEFFSLFPKKRAEATQIFEETYEHMHQPA